MRSTHWSNTVILYEAVITALKIISLNNFDKITVKEQQHLASEVLKEVKKPKSKKELKNLLNNTQFDQIVYKQLATVYNNR